MSLLHSSSRRRVLVEPLEARIAPAIVFWDGGGDGVNWNSAGNWSDDAVPNSLDDVTINPAGDVTVSIVAGNFSVNSLAMPGDDGLSLTGGTLTLAAASSIHDLTLSGARITASAQVTLTGAGTWLSEGYFTGGPFRNEGTLAITSNVVHLESATLTNAGTITQTGGRLDFNGTGSVLNNLAGGVYEVLTAGNNTFLGNFSGTETFLNAGTLRRDGTGNADMNGVTFVNDSGTIAAVTGTLQLNVAGSMNSATFNVSSGAAVTLAGMNHTWAGTFTGAGAGDVLFTGANITADAGGATLNFPAGLFDWQSEGYFRGGTTTNTGVIQITSGAAHLDSATLINTGTITQTGGRLDFNGTNSLLHNAVGGVYEVTVAGINTFLGNFSGTETFLNAGTLRRDGTGNADMNGVNLVNTASGVFQAMSGVLQLNVAGTMEGATFNVSSGAAVTLAGMNQTWTGTFGGAGAGDVFFTGANITAGAGGATLDFPAGMFDWDSEGYFRGGVTTNTGVITITGGAAHLDSATLINTGTITQTNGRLDFNGVGSVLHNLAGGVYEVLTAGNNTFLGNFSGTETFLNAGTLRRDGTGNADMNGVNLVNTASGVFQAISGVLQLNVGGTMEGATFNVSSGAAVTLAGMNQTWTGTFTGAGAGDVFFTGANITPAASSPVLNFPAGLFDWDSEGYFHNGTATNTGFIQITGGAVHLDSATLLNGGTVTQTNGRLDFNGTGSVLNNLAGGVYEVLTAGNNTFLGNFSGTETFLNAGTLRRDGTGNADMNGVNLVNTASGVFEALTGSLQLNVGGTMAGATFNVSSGAAVTLAGMNQTWTGTFGGAGAGDVFFTGANITAGAAGTTLDLPAGMFDWDSEGYFRGGVITNTGVITITGGAAHLENATLINTGTITQTGGRLDFNGGGSLLNNAASGLYEVKIASGPFVGNFSSSEQFTNAGTLWRDGAGSADLNGVTFSNTGVVEVVNGGLAINGPLSNLAGGVLTGGTWIARNGANLNLPAAVTTNAATIAIDGGTVTGLGTLAANSGALTVRAGSDFTTTAAFSNTGTLRLGEGSVFTAPGFTQSAAGTLELEVGGATAADHGRLAITGAAAFGGTARVVIASDYPPAVGDTLTLATYGSTNGNFANFDGLNLTRTPVFERFVGPNSLTLNALENAANLDVVSVTAPANGFAGQDFAISYQVTNTSAFATIATTWTDTVYLSLDDTLDRSDIVLARRAHTGALGSGASYTDSFSVPLTGTVFGDYKVLVLADSRGFVADPDRDNNLGAAATASTLDIPALTDGVPVNGTIRAGQELWYRLTVPAGETPNFTFTGALASQAEVYVSFGEVPTRADYLQKAFTLGAAKQQILGEATAAGTYYVLLHGRENAGAGGQTFSLVGDSIGFELLGTSLAGGPNVGKVTTTLSGAQFSPGTTFTLVAGATTRAAEATYFVNSRTVHATFDLTGLAAGSYDIVADKGATTDELDDAFAVTAGGTAGTLKYSISSPRYVRPQGGTVTVTYENNGGTDLDAPLFTLLAENARLQLSGTTGFIGAAYEFDGQPFSVTELLGVSGGLAGILSPGEKATIELNFQAIDSTVGQKAKFEVLSLGATDDAFDLATLVEELKPAGVREDAWQAIFTNFQAGVGTTVNSYRQMLVENANYLGQFEAVSPDITRLIEFELEQAGEFGAIVDRFTLGALGRGQVAPFSLQAFTAANGTVTLSDGENTRVFFQGAGGAFIGSGVEPGKLTRGTDGTITLTEAYGRKTVFRASDGRIDFIEESNGQRATATYNAGSQLTSITDSVTGNANTFTYNAQGRIATATDAAGRVTTYGYDAGGEHLSSVATPQGTTTFSYTSGQGAASEHALASITSGGVTTSFTYDARGRLASKTIGTGAEALVTTYGYDHAGLQSVTEPGARESQIFRTFDGNVTRTIDPLGDVTTIRYDTAGRIVSITDPDGLTTRNSLDAAGLLNGIQGADRAQTGVTLGDSNLRLQSVTDPGGDTTRFLYDPLGNLLSITLPDGAAKTNEYDASGRIVATTDASGVRTTFTYNADARVTQRAFPGGQIDLTYDTHGNLLTATDAEGATTFTYDTGDRVASVAYPNGKSVAITYDAFGRRATVADGTGYTVRYSYDSLGRIDEVRDTADVLLVDYGYDAIGQLASETRGNGSSTLYTYDSAGRAATITHRDAANATTGSFAYTYDAQDRVQTATTAAGVATYSYDLGGQLSRAELPGGRVITYSYDAEGNRTSVSDSTAGTEGYATNIGDQYTTAGEETLTYDRDGRLITRSEGGVTTSYTYDALGNLSGITAPGSVTTFDYDALGNRIGKTENGVRTDYANDPFGLGTLFGEYNGATATHFASGLGVAARESGGSTAFYHFDGVGNTALVSGAAGAAVASYSYLPFGEIAAQTGTLAQPFTFNGQLGIQDDPGDLFHMRARTYSAELGRFITRDPIGLASGDANIYRFADNDPINANDPSGLLTPLQIQAYEYLYGEVAIGEIGTFVAGLFTEAEAAAVVAGAGSSIPAAASPSVAALLGAGSFAVLEAAVVIGGVAVLTDPSLTINAIEHYDQYFRDNRDEHAKKLGYPDPNEPHFDKDFIDEWGKNPYFTDLVKKGLADGQTQQEAILDAVRILKKLGLDKERKPDDKTESEVVRPSDPNNVIGPAGPGADPVPEIIAPGQFRFDGFVNSEADFGYTIQFENQPSATAPAQVVIVTQTLDTDLDFSTFRFTSFGFGAFKIDVPAGADGTSFETIYDGALATLGVLVQIEAELNTVSGLLQVTFTSLDPATNEVPADPFEGFLPANLVAPQGDGFLTYSVAPDAALASGTEFTAIASIVFDTEDAIATPTVTNTLDDIAPTSTITAFASATSNRQNIAVRWTSADNVGGAGLSGTTIFVSDNDGPLEAITVDDGASGIRFTGEVGHTYKFFSQAIDAVGNKETIAALPDAAVTVVAPLLLTADGNKITLTDIDGDIYTVKLAGPVGATLKYLQLDQDPGAGVRGPLDFLVVENGTDKHSLTVTVKRAKDGPDLDRLPDGDGIVAIGDVIINGALGSFTAKASDLNANGFTATGTVKSIAVRDLLQPDVFAADPALKTGGLAASKLKIAVRNLGDGFRIDTDQALTSLTAEDIGDGRIAAASLGSLKATKGALDADLVIGGAVGAITAKLGANAGTWIGGSFGAIKLGGALAADITSAGAIASVSVTGGGLLGDFVAGAPFDKKPAIGNVTITGGDLSGSLTAAGKLGNVTVKEDKAGGGGAISGDVTAASIGNIALTGGGLAGSLTSTADTTTLGMLAALGNVKITGGDLTGDIDALGKAGSLTIKADKAGVGGGLSGILIAGSFGKFALTGGDFSGSVTAIATATALGKTLAIGGVSVAGGDLTGNLRALGGIGAVKTSASSAGVGGSVSDATIAAARIASLTVAKNLANSLILAGADLGTDFAPGGTGDAADLFAAGTLGAVKITGNVTAGTIAAGLSSTNSTLKDGDDLILGGADSVIASLTITGTADAASYFAAGKFKTTPRITGATVDPATDLRFKLG